MEVSVEFSGGEKQTFEVGYVDPDSFFDKVKKIVFESITGVKYEDFDDKLLILTQINNTEFSVEPTEYAISLSEVDIDDSWINMDRFEVSVLKQFNFLNDKSVSARNKYKYIQKINALENNIMTAISFSRTMAVLHRDYIACPESVSKTLEKIGCKKYFSESSGPVNCDYDGDGEYVNR